MRVVIYGSRPDGHAKVCLRVVRRLGWDCLGCLDDFPEHAIRSLDGMAVLGGRSALASLPDKGVEGIVLGVGEGRGRRELVKPIQAAGLRLPALIDPAANCADSAKVAKGAVVLPGAVVGDDVRVGEAALINVGALLTHDVYVAAGASVGPGAVLSGRSQVGRDAQLGAGAVLLPDAVVGDDSVVGAGAVVTHEVGPGVTAVGVPARPK